MERIGIVIIVAQPDGTTALEHSEAYVVESRQDLEELFSLYSDNSREELVN